MFELPEAKRIRRDEILSPSSPVRRSPQMIQAFDDEDACARLGRILAFDTFTPETNYDRERESNENSNEDLATAAHDSQGDKQDGDEQEFEFRLFSAASNAKSSASATTTANSNPVKNIPNKNNDAEAKADDGIKIQKLKIRLRSPTPNDNSNPLSLEYGRLVVPSRGWNYYFTTPELMNISAGDQSRLLDTEETRGKRKEYEDIAVTGAEVLHWAQTAETPGWHLPWRVVHLKQEHGGARGSAGTAKNISTTISSITATAAEKAKSKKPGKKRRIFLRTRAAAVAAATTAAAATASMTEAEKRNKKNREKKARKRQRERERKAALTASTGGAVVPDIEHTSDGEPSD